MEEKKIFQRQFVWFFVFCLFNLCQIYFAKPSYPIGLNNFQEQSTNANITHSIQQGDFVINKSLSWEASDALLMEHLSSHHAQRLL